MYFWPLGNRLSIVKKGIPQASSILQRVSRQSDSSVGVSNFQKTAERCSGERMMRTEYNDYISSCPDSRISLLSRKNK